jgi:HlyD family secretion protein
MKRRTKVILGVVGIAAVLGGVGVVRSKASGSADGSTKTVSVTRGEIVEKALAIGQIEPRVQISVKSQVSGVVGRLYADEGDFVHAGDPLLEVKPTPTPLELADARRQVELRQIELDNLKRDITRQGALQTQGLVSDQQYETTQQNYAESQVQLKMAQERLALLEQGKVSTSAGSIETVVRSPITGFILEKSVQLGDPVVPLTTYQEGTVLMTMAEMKDLLFRGTVDEIDVGKLKEGMPVTIKIGALPEAKIDGILAKISLKGKKQDNATVFPVELSLTETHGTKLRAGYSANADIIIARRDSALMIPERVVTFSGDSATVTIVLPDGKTETRAIKTGLSDALNIEVLSGLGQGDKVAEPAVREIK